MLLVAPVAVACDGATTRTLGGVDAALDAADVSTGAPDVGHPDLGPVDTGPRADAATPDLGAPDVGVEVCPAPPPTTPRIDALPPSCDVPPDFDDVVRSPRPDVVAEVLAGGLARGESGVATEEAYVTAYRDLCRLRELDPFVAEFEEGFDVLTMLVLFVEQEAFDEMRDGVYGPWRCLNAMYGVERTSFEDRFGLQVSLQISARAAQLNLTRPYAALPGVRSATGGPFLPLFEPRIACAFERDDGSRHYVLTRGGGDCPAGCTEWYARAYRVVGDVAETVAEWDSTVDPEAPPEVQPAECVVSIGF
jgi:hypothetical protein